MELEPTIEIFAFLSVGSAWFLGTYTMKTHIQPNMIFWGGKDLFTLVKLSKGSEEGHSDEVISDRHTKNIPSTSQRVTDVITIL